MDVAIVFWLGWLAKDCEVQGSNHKKNASDLYICLVAVIHTGKYLNGVIERDVANLSVITKSQNLCSSRLNIGLQLVPIKAF